MRRPVLLLALSLLPLVSHADEVLLRRYVPLEAYVDHNPGVQAFRGACRYTYMDVEDTHLSAAAPDANFGRSDTLEITDPARDAILIAFRLLYRAVPPEREIGEVELFLAPARAPDPATTIEVRRVLLPWRDGGGRGQAEPCAATFNDRYAAEAAFARPWTQPGGRADCAAEPSFRGKLGELFDAARGGYVLRGPGLTADVREWHGRHYRNYGWLITAAGGPVAFHASDVLEEARRPALRMVHARPAKRVTKEKQLPDLDVTHIERTPRYSRYNDNGRTSYERVPFRGDEPGIMTQPDYAQYPKHPAPGELVVFIAHVLNASDQPYRGPVSYRWKINDRVLREKGSGQSRLADGREVAPTLVELGPWEEFTTRLEWDWAVDLADHRKVVLEFEVDWEGGIDEVSEHNNALTKYVAGKTLKYWVERDVYEYVKEYATCWGSASFEDYLQWHFDVWNETYFNQSRFDDIAPGGCVQRVTLDAFEIVPNGFLGGGIHRAEDELDPRFDGEWGTEWVPADTEKESERKGFYDFLQRHRVVLEPSLLHECSHQTFGAYDIYWSNIEPSEPDKPVGKCKIRDETGKYIPRGSAFPYAGLMGGDDTRPNPQYWTSTELYSANTVGGANTNARFRNGFYGDWQYDLPRECAVQLRSQDGRPLAGAEVTIWQQTWKGITEETGLVARGLKAGPDGVLRLPDQDSLAPGDVTTLTGHTLRKLNPWGRLDVVAQNITLLLQVNACGQRDYQFVRSLEFNRAYWRGERERHVQPLLCRISPSERVDLTKNVAQGARATASLKPEDAGKLVDGNVETHWAGGPAEAGDFIEIELPQAASVGVIRIVQDSAHGQFFQRFAITTRAAPGAPAEPFATQAPYPFGVAMGCDKDVNNDRPSERWVTYAATPRATRVIRIEALDGGGTHVSEVRVYAERE